MARFMHSFNTSTFRRRNILLAMSWTFGLGSGALAFRYGGDHIVSLMPSLLSSRLSIVGLAASALLPFLFSVFAVYFSAPLLLIVVCFAKAFLFAYISCGIHGCFVEAGWLVHWLALFVDAFSIPVLYLYWQQHISGVRCFRIRTAGVYLALLLLIITLGHRFLGPVTGALSFLQKG